jgi:predicted outer membrane repeat protein
MYVLQKTLTAHSTTCPCQCRTQLHLYTTCGPCRQVENSTQLVISNSTFQENSGRAAGCVLADHVASMQVADCVFLNNTGTGNNLEGGAGAVIMRNVSNVTLADTTFVGNTAMMGAGGAVHCADCGQQAYHQLLFRDNVALYGPGGALHQTGMNGATHVDGCSFSNNEASLNGGALSSVLVNATACVESVAGCRLVVVNCTFDHNTAGAGSHSGGGGGGGVYVEQLASTRRAVLVVNSSFVNNTARSQVAFSLDVDARGTGGALAVLGQHNLCAFLYNSTVHSNRATYGGGAVSSVWGGGVVIRNSSLQHNSAGVQGGAVLVYKFIMNLAHVSVAGASAGLCCLQLLSKQRTHGQTHSFQIMCLGLDTHHIMSICPPVLRFCTGCTMLEAAHDL